ncbi:hypothetical protein ACQ4WX_26455 [Streptomyces lasalocidi]
MANQIEEAPAVRTALLEARSDALLAGYCHYLPFSFNGGGQLLLDPSLSDAGLGRPVLLAFAARPGCLRPGTGPLLDGCLLGVGRRRPDDGGPG